MQSWDLIHFTYSSYIFSLYNMTPLLSYVSICIIFIMQLSTSSSSSIGPNIIPIMMEDVFSYHEVISCERCIFILQFLFLFSRNTENKNSNLMEIIVILRFNTNRNTVSCEIKCNAFILNKK